jgi:hypothetical protein
MAGLIYAGGDQREFSALCDNEQIFLQKYPTFPRFYVEGGVLVFVHFNIREYGSCEKVGYA